MAAKITSPSSCDQARSTPVQFRTLADHSPADPGGVTVWHCPEDEARANCLSDDELTRANRYRSDAARRQFLSSRGALRLVLSCILHQPPQAIVIQIAADGKPYLPGHAVEFNLSHTAGLALVATAPVPVGIDVELVRTVENADQLVARYFSAGEQAEFATLAAELRPSAFLRGWTHKEAVLKGIGCGVRDLDRCQVRLDPRTPPQIVAPQETANQWALTTWQPTEATVAALAVSLQ